MRPRFSIQVVDVARGLILFVWLITTYWYLVNRTNFELYAIGDSVVLRWHFLAASGLITVLAFFNLIDMFIRKDKAWLTYTLFLFVAMAFGCLGDFLGGLTGLPIDPLLLLIVAFGIGNFFYFLALKDLSPLLFLSSEIKKPGQSPHQIIRRNLIIWIIFILLGLGLFFLTLYNPVELVYSIGMLCYGLFFLTILAFAFTKFFSQLSPYFRLLLFLGFLLFFISDYLLALNTLTIPLLHATLLIHETYLPGQLVIHLTPIIGSVTRIK